MTALRGDIGDYVDYLGVARLANELGFDRGAEQRVRKRDSKEDTKPVSVRDSRGAWRSGPGG